jgi:sugar O-acyltransferase (sialic acid O-acetyltransferase NeuD family)
MTRKPLLLVGASGHAHALLALLQRHGGYEPLGLIDSFQPAGRQVYGLTILGSEADVPELCVKHGSHHLLVAIGDNYQRQAMTERLRKRLADVRFPSLVDPTAVMASNAQLGAGVVVMPRAHVGAGCLLAEGSLLNTGASLDHDSSLGAFASMAPGVVTGGDVQINERSAIGLGALLTHRIRIGSDTVVGAGSLVITDLPSRIVAYGSPASVIRSRQPDEPYL